MRGEVQRDHRREAPIKSLAPSRLMGGGSAPPRFLFLFQPLAHGFGQWRRSGWRRWSGSHDADVVEQRFAGLDIVNPCHECILLPPAWREIDSDPRWHEWLSQTDPFTGATHQQVLDDAIAAGSASRVIAFFNGFLAQIGSAV
jgi:hypothetical protein